MSPKRAAFTLALVVNVLWARARHSSPWGPES